MSMTPFMLESYFNHNPLLQKTFSFPPLQSKSHNAALKKNHSSYKPITVSPKFRIKCLIIDHNPKGENEDTGGGDDHLDMKKAVVHSGVNRATSISMEDVIKTPIVTGLLLGGLLFYDHRHAPIALAASGGRMGRSSFSSRRSSRSSRRSSRISRSRTSSSRSSSRPSYSSSGSLTTSPEQSSSSETYMAQISSPVLVQPAKDSKTEELMCYLVLFVLWRFLEGLFNFLFPGLATDNTSVIKLQVGLLGTGRSMQGDLNKIAEAADTSTSNGLNCLLQETIVALLRHPDYYTSAYSSVVVKTKGNEEEAEKLFKQLSIEERGKFDEETLVNVNNIKMQSATTHDSNGLRNEYIVVTIIVAAKGIIKLPPIKSIAQLKQALQKLASISSDNIKAAEVLWTPQKEDDSLTEEEYRRDYPLLHPL